MGKPTVKKRPAATTLSAASRRAIDARAKKFNLRKLAVEISKMEGRKEQLSIAQISEVIGCLGRRWRDLCADVDFLVEVVAILDRAGTRRR